MKGYPRLGDTMPNTTMQIIAAQLPENVLSLRLLSDWHCILLGKRNEPAKMLGAKRQGGNLMFRVPIGFALLLCTTMQIIAAQLPENVLSLRDCALQHSLFPFRMRFQPLEKKREYLQEFLDGDI